MLFEVLQNHFDAQNTPQGARTQVARHMVRYILGIETSIPALAKELRLVVSDDHVSATSSELRRLAWDQHTMTCYWRALSSYLDTRDTYALRDLNVPVPDVYHMMSVLDTADIDAFALQSRDWRKPVISEHVAHSILGKLRRTIDKCVGNMAWLWNVDTGITDHDWRGFMNIEALRLIYLHESEYTVTYLLRTCAVAIENQSINMMKKYQSPSHSVFAPTDTCLDLIAADSKDVSHYKSKNAKRTYDSSLRTPARTDLVHTTDDGDDIDVPALHGQTVPSCESEVTASVFISKVSRSRPHVGRYLSIIVNGVDPQGSYYDYNTSFSQTDAVAALKCCGVTADDMVWLRSQAMPLKVA